MKGTAENNDGTMPRFVRSCFQRWLHRRASSLLLSPLLSFLDIVITTKIIIATHNKMTGDILGTLSSSANIE